MAESLSPKRSLLTVAIDFGTTYSGFAFQFWDDYSDKDPTHRIFAPQIWNDGSVQVASNKCPTCLLLDSTGKINSFGYEAERKFADLCEEEEENEKQWFFFRRFKMKLQDPKDISKSTLIEDEMKKTLPAIEVFSKSIQCLMMKLTEEINRKLPEIDVHLTDMSYVLTVPAIWSDKAKDFMRSAAKMAGIPNNKLTISLEPESASLYCQYLPVDRFSVGGEAQVSLAAPGTVYMIVDLGGGTADITVHEKLQNGKLREVHSACGGPWGGTAVDTFFIQLLSSVVTPIAMSEFMYNHCGEYLDLMRELEVVKRSVDATSDRKFNMKIPGLLSELAKKYLKKSFAEAVVDSPHASEMKVVGDKLKISANEARNLFSRVVDKIAQQIQKCFDDVSKMASSRTISLILMVGGFSESKYVQDMIKQRFEASGDVKVLIPEEAGLAVLKGAVVFGRQPESIQSRILRYTYGAEITPPFDPLKYDESKRTKDGKRCANVFKPFMERGKEIRQGESLVSTYHTTAPFQKTIALKIFCTENDSSVKYTTDKGCNFVGTLTMKLNNPTQELKDLKVEYIFGGTELKVVGQEADSKYQCETVIKMNA